jgi:protein-L-isoaspartate(D-aspartate) O-methyltransferase
MFIPILICILTLSLLFASSCVLPNYSQDYSSDEVPQELSPDSFWQQRQQMVLAQIKQRGISTPAVLAAMSTVPRHYFVSSELAPFAYSDSALPIDYGQTISQPYIVAYMTEIAEIQPTDKVLEIGTGSGYQAAILGELAQQVYTIEIIPELAQKARHILKKLGYENILVKIGDGYQGWSKYAPYDAILVTAAPEKIPPALVEQLALNGKMIIPVGKYYQEIVIITKTNDGITKQKTIPVRFVPMTTNSEEN